MKTSQYRPRLCSFRKLEKVNRFSDVAVGTEVIARREVLFFREDVRITTGSRFVRCVRANPFQYLQAIHLGQFEVKQNQG